MEERNETAFTPGPWKAFDVSEMHSEPMFMVGPREYCSIAEVRAGSTEAEETGDVAANARLIAAAPALYEALSGVEFIFSRPGEDSVERFERLAAAFYRDTGVMMPGKDTPAAGDQPDIEESRKKYDAWIDAKVAAARSALLLANTGGTENG